MSAILHAAASLQLTHIQKLIWKAVGKVILLYNVWEQKMALENIIIALQSATYFRSFSAFYLFSLRTKDL